MPNRLWLNYIPYGAIDLILVIAIISELVNKRFDLLLANVPLLGIGLWSFSRKLREALDDPAD